MTRWLRFKKGLPCPVCRRERWCGYADDDPSTVICMREPSDRPTANGGWLHKQDDFAKHPSQFAKFRNLESLPKPEPPRADFTSMWRRWLERTDHYHVDGFAMSLGVDTDALKALGCAWTGTEWAFPMRDEAGRCIGIRLRDEWGRKWAVRGSKSGLFIPEGQTPAECLYVVEGPTDAAAALTLGLSVAGRASCAGGEEMLAAYVRRAGARRVLIVADADEAGLRGSERLKAALRTPAVVWTPPCKDLREFVRAGGSAAVIQSATKDLMFGEMR